AKEQAELEKQKQLAELRRIEAEKAAQEQRAKEEEARQIAAAQKKREQDAVSKELDKIMQKAKTNAVKSSEKTTLAEKCKEYTKGSEPQPEKNDYIKMQSVDEILAQIEKRTQEMVHDDTAAGITPDIPEKQQSMPTKVHTVKIQPKKVERKHDSPEPEIKVIPVKKANVTPPPATVTTDIPTEGDEYIDAQTITAPKTDITFEVLEDEFKTSTFDLPDKEQGVKKSYTEEFKTNIFDQIKAAAVEVSQDGYDEPEEYDDDEPEDEYLSVNDRSRIYKNILKKLRACNLRIFFTAILAIAALGCELPMVAASSTAAGYIAVASLVVAFFVNFDTVKKIAHIGGTDFDGAAPVGFLSILSVIYNLLTVTVFAGKVSTLCFAPIFIMVLTQIGIHNQYSRIKMNFKVVAKDGEKSALLFCNDRKISGQIAALTEFDAANILYRKPTDMVGGLMKNSLSKGIKNKRCFAVFIIGIILSAVAFGVALFTSSPAYALFVFMLGLCITCSPVSVFIANLPLRIAASRLNYYNAALFGENSIEQLDNTNVVTAYAGELFPEGSVKLVNFKLLSPNPIDQTLLDAHALASYMNSPLAGIFAQIASEEKVADCKVDSTAYEENMGISGWVDDRRVFIGNRTLMQAHGFTLPSGEIDKNILRKGCFPVYLGSEGVLCALLLVKYEVDPEVSYEMSRLISTGATVLVKNCDSNISKEMLEDYFGLDEQSIYLMPHNILPEYSRMTEKKDTVNACACAGTFRGHAASVTAAIKAKKLSLAMFIIYTVLTVLALTCLALMVATQNINFLTSLTLGLYSLISLLLSIILPFIDRP
ncbi:MAG: hypothetical protein KBS41_04090, partial [Oscillospiraceae bacterium]|nr:hypothetical protein [Candidatus Equicaccousia limihippi]